MKDNAKDMEIPDYAFIDRHDGVFSFLKLTATRNVIKELSGI